MELGYFGTQLLCTSTRCDKFCGGPKVWLWVGQPFWVSVMPSHHRSNCGEDPLIIYCRQRTLKLSLRQLASSQIERVSRLGHQNLLARSITDGSLMIYNYYESMWILGFHTKLMVCLPDSPQLLVKQAVFQIPFLWVDFTSLLVGWDMLHSDWWFETFFIFPYIGNVIIQLTNSYFSEGYVYTTNQNYVKNYVKSCWIMSDHMI